MSTYTCALIIDDDPDACFLNKLILTGFDFATHTHISYDALNGLNFVRENCVEQVNTEEVLCPDVIFLDISMPVMDGFGFLKEFRDFNFPGKKPKIFILSSSNHENDIERAKEFDIDAYIVKPLTKQKLGELMKAFS
jgi:CheY-like chemotaxis protein